jgi:hypothetical protein
MNFDVCTINREVLVICCEAAINNDYGLFITPIRSETIEQMAAQQGISVQSVDGAIRVLHDQSFIRKERPYKPYFIYLTFWGIKSYLSERYPYFDEIKTNVARALIGQYLPTDAQLVAMIHQPRWLIVAALAALQQEGLLRIEGGQANMQVRHISDMLRLRYGQP